MKKLCEIYFHEKTGSEIYLFCLVFKTFNLINIFLIFYHKAKCYVNFTIFLIRKILKVLKTPRTQSHFKNKKIIFLTFVTLFALIEMQYLGNTFYIMQLSDFARSWCELTKLYIGCEPPGVRFLWYCLQKEYIMEPMFMQDLAPWLMRYVRARLRILF